MLKGFVRSAEILHAAAASSVSLLLISRHGLTNWKHALQHQCRVLPLGPAPVLGEAPFQETVIPVVSNHFVQMLTWRLPAADIDLAGKVACYQGYCLTCTYYFVACMPSSDWPTCGPGRGTCGRQPCWAKVAVARWLPSALGP